MGNAGNAVCANVIDRVFAVEVTNKLLTIRLHLIKNCGNILRTVEKEGGYAMERGHSIQSYKDAE